jgi:diguanylate cyclase (GGDEF)-like protein
MPSAPRFLDKLVNMTAIHDLELMEYSLLKTLEEFIRAEVLLILKIDRNGVPCYQLTLRKEKYEIIWEDIVIPDIIHTGIEIVRRTAKPLSRMAESGDFITIWHILQSKSHEVFLVTTTAVALNTLDRHMINGLLGIYRNFYAVLSDSQRDQLTGLANRKTFDDTIGKITSNRFNTKDTKEAVQLERRMKIPQESEKFWLGMADLDNFKRINDTWGHLYGDEVLLLTSQIMQGHFRQNDYLFRFGGEEFVIIIRTADEESARVTFERFRLCLEEHTFPQIGKITISIGITEINPSIFTATLLDQADKALYFAKQNGRNQICFYDTLVQQGIVKENEILTGGIEFF